MNLSKKEILKLLKKSLLKLKLFNNELPDFDLEVIEEMRHWLEYNPPCHKDRINGYFELHVRRIQEDQSLPPKIEMLYKYVKKQQNGKLDLTDNHFQLNENLLPEYVCKKTLRFVGDEANVLRYFRIILHAELKLSNEVLEQVKQFMENYSKDKLPEMWAVALKQEDFYIRSYTLCLLRCFMLDEEFGRVVLETTYFDDERKQEKERYIAEREASEKKTLYRRVW